MIGTLITVAAAVNAALLALALAYRSWGKRAPAGLYAAAYLACAAAAVALIALDHANLINDEVVSAFLEGALTLATGPLLVLFIGALLGVRTGAHWGLGFIAAFIAASLAAPVFVLNAFFAERLVLVQMGFTAWAAVLALRFAPAGRRGVTARNLALAAVSAVAILHVGQVLRMALPNVDAIANVVPLIGAAVFLVATAAIYLGGRISALEPIIDAPPIAGDAERALAARLGAALRGGLMREAKLTLPQAAAALNVPSQALARAVTAVHSKSFVEHVQRMRVDEARRMLSDPDEARTSMEAIGVLVGFGSRSAFYKAFNDHVGVSPAAYREAHAQNPVQKT